MDLNRAKNILEKKGYEDVTEIVGIALSVDDPTGYVRGEDYDRDLYIEDVTFELEKVSLTFFSCIYSYKYYEAHFNIIKDSRGIGDIMIVYDGEFNYIDDYLKFRQP